VPTPLHSPTEGDRERWGATLVGLFDGEVSTSSCLPFPCATGDRSESDEEDDEGLKWSQDRSSAEGREELVPTA
jgi:hypothetical protein